MNLSFQRLFFAIATVFALFAILILAKPILIPLGFALLTSFILYPLVKRIESYGINAIFSAFLSIFLMLLIIGGCIFFFSAQMISITKQFSNFQGKILIVLTETTLFINDNLNFLPDLEKNELSDLIKDWLGESSGAMLKVSFNNTKAFLTGLLATIVFTFLILIYRKGLTVALSSFAQLDKRQRVVDMFKSVQQVGQKYLFGMIILILLVGFANSIGLLIIGIDNPFLFGFLGAVAAIIPYIGTVSGAIIPVLYAFFYCESFWMAVAVAVLFWIVQLVSDNFLSPKILGASLNINAFASILSLIIGSVIWGIAGMILFLPFAAMLWVVCNEYEELKPIALLIGNQNYNESASKTKLMKSLKFWS